MRTKHISPILIMLFFVFTSAAQPGINYKAILYDDNGNALANTIVSVQFTILENGTINVFQETHNATTDANGIIIVNIGEGTLIGGDFNTIDWGSNPHFLKTEVDSGDGLIHMGTTEFKAVPYALHARIAESVSGSSSQTPSLDDVLNAGNSANSQIKDVSNPTDSHDAVTKAYVDVLLERMDEIEDKVLILTGDYLLEDIEGNKYQTVLLGNQLWMSENLLTTKFNDGSIIPKVSDDIEWANCTSPAYCWYDNDSILYSHTYGALYNGYTAISDKLCPIGWRVPTDDDWKELEIFLGMDPVHANSEGSRGTDEGSKLAGNADLWYSYGDLVNNSEFGTSLFTGLPGGVRTYIAEYKYISYMADWWSNTVSWSSSDDSYPPLIIFRRLDWQYSGVERRSYDATIGMSIRCVKNF